MAPAARSTSSRSAFGARPVPRTGRPLSENSDTAVAIGFEGVKHPTQDLVIRGNDFTSDLPNLTSFVHNRTSTPALLSGNHLHSQVTPLIGPGTVSP
jgi:hypothetical protein